MTRRSDYDYSPAPEAAPEPKILEGPLPPGEKVPTGWGYHCQACGQTAVGSRCGCVPPEAA